MIILKKERKAGILFKTITTTTEFQSELGKLFWASLESAVK